MRQRGLGITWWWELVYVEVAPWRWRWRPSVCTVQGCGCPLPTAHSTCCGCADGCVCVRVWPVWLALARYRYAADTAARNGKRRRNLWEALSHPTAPAPNTSLSLFSSSSTYIHTHYGRLDTPLALPVRCACTTRHISIADSFTMRPNFCHSLRQPSSSADVLEAEQGEHLLQRHSQFRPVLCRFREPQRPIVARRGLRDQDRYSRPRRPQEDHHSPA